MADQQPHTTQNVAPKASPQGSIATGTGPAATATTGGEQPGAKGTVSGTGSGSAQLRGAAQPGAQGAAQQGAAQDQRIQVAAQDQRTREQDQRTQDQAQQDQQRAQEERPKPTPPVSGVVEGDKVRVRRGSDGEEFEATVSRVWSPQYVRVEWQDEKGGAQMIDNVSNGGDEQRYKDVVLSKV